MLTLEINLSLIEYIALPIVATILGVTIYFFIQSQRSLRETIRANNLYPPKIKKEKPVTTTRRSTLADLEEQFAKKRKDAFVAREETSTITNSPAHKETNIVQELKSTISQQQKLLNSYLSQVEELENEGKEEIRQENNDLQREITKLHGIIESKDAEIEDLFLQATSAQKMASKIEEVYEEFDVLQSKMQLLEQQANRANNLAMELEDTKHSYEAIHKELLRKHEKLEEVMEDSQQMRQDMNTLEDKLSEANLQRQQLHKKVQFLTDLNNDMQSLSDTNKKLQTEIKRIGELESMLNMMAEERDYLLKKKNK